MIVGVSELVTGLALLSICYFFLINSIYLFLLLAAVVALRRQSRSAPLESSMQKSKLPFSPEISILAPAYNEAATVVESVQSFLMLNYPSFEVIVINDGSKDNTLEKLQNAFLLEPIDIIYDSTLSQTEVRGAYRSRLHPHLSVIDKVNGGKADALNIGIGFAKHELFCAVDSDSLLENDALLRVSAPFLEAPNEVVASGGTVRIANGSKVSYGRVESIGLPKNIIVWMQIIEYTRAFLCGRIGWNVLNATLVISGAFGLFSKRAVKSIGGYTADSVGEDMELILRLHEHFRSRKQKYTITFVPDPVCWTEAPSDLTSLGKQRDRWQRGLADTLFRHRRMLFNPRYGFIGWLAFPYFLFVELLGPLFEVFSLAVILIAVCSGEMQGLLFWTFFAASILYGTVLSMASLVIEEIYFSKYDRAGQFLALFFTCLIESLWYRQISTFWRLRGILKYLKGDRAWGHLSRTGFSKTGPL